MAYKEVSRVGRPLAFKTEIELAKAIDNYFNECDSRIKTFVDKDGNETTALVPAPYTLSGLALAIGMDRWRLLQYEAKERYYPTIQQARRRVEADLERRLLETSNQAGAIFALKNNYGWRDERQIEATTRQETTVIYRPEKLPDIVEGEIVDQPKLEGNNKAS